MGRFYNGQPVVCVKDKAWWSTGNGLMPGSPMPVLGDRYVVIRTEPHPTYGHDGVMLRELGWWFYRETGFAPITNSQVRGIIEEAHRTPVDEHAADRETAWRRLARRLRERVS